MAITLTRRSHSTMAPPGVHLSSSSMRSSVSHSTRNRSPQIHSEEQIEVDPLLCYSQYERAPGYANQLIWDLREHPSVARSVTTIAVPLAGSQLSQPATVPMTSSLNIVCDIFLPSWVIKIRKFQWHITAGDVLNDVHTFLYQPITQQEWHSLPDKKRRCISSAFETRCSQSYDREGAWRTGILRIDTLMNHTWFAGLSASLDKRNTCILSLRRPR